MLQEIMLRPELAGFIQGGVSIRLASCGGDGKPVAGRALAAVVADGHRDIRLLVAAIANAPILQAVKETGKIAAAFTQPTTHRSIQIKGADAVVGPALAEDRERIDRQCRALALELKELFFPPPFVRATGACEPGDLASISFTCMSLFDQTPGPRAGEAVAP